MIKKPRKNPIEVRFWKKIIKRDGCWIWSSVKFGSYGRIGERGKVVGAHRFSYELHKGKIPKGYVMDHLCRNPSCVNPEHLEAVTHTVNKIRGNGWAGKNYRAINCPKGHLYYGNNLYIRPDGYRDCKECQRNRVKNHRNKI